MAISNHRMFQFVSFRPNHGRPLGAVYARAVLANAFLKSPLLAATIKVKRCYFALRRDIMVRNFSAQPGRSSCGDRSSASAPALTSFVITLPDPI